jgi:hypothetical protein
MRGAAYVYRYTDGQWQQAARLIASDPTPNANFGWSVDVSGTRVVIGAPHAHEPPGTVRGAAYVFTDTNGHWGQESRLVATDFHGAGTPNTSFGQGVAIGGDVIAIGAPGVRVTNPEVGRVLIYSRATGIWQRDAVLAASNPTRFARFGQLVAFDGQRLGVAAAGERDAADVSLGAAYIFAPRENQWVEGIRVVASDARPLQGFASDAIALDGGRLIIGVPYDGNGTGTRYGAAYDYELICAGDVNGDWVVGTADLAIVLSTFGTPAGATPDAGDLDRDGDVDLADLTLLLGRFGDRCP